MTMLSRLNFHLKKKGVMKSERIAINDISIVIPVKDNQKGINEFLRTFFQSQTQKNFPKEIIIVDNLSIVPTIIKPEFEGKGILINLIRCNHQGPSSARNTGVRVARGNWILFLDSDCLFTQSTIQGYLQSCNNSIAYAGIVKSKSDDFISKYYEEQEILVPLKVELNKGEFAPQYLITANCLVWKEAFCAIGGFNETIKIAGGEDIDLGLRLSEIGTLSFAIESVALHDFGDGIWGFVNRFIRYGKGNRIIEEIYGTDLSPNLFRPNKITFVNELLARIQWICLNIGYRRMSKDLLNDSNI